MPGPNIDHFPQSGLAAELMERFPDGLLVFDATTRELLDINASACQRLGVGREEIDRKALAGTACPEVLSPDGQDIEYCARVLRPDGSGVATRVRQSLVTLGATPCWLVVWQDTEPSQNLDEALRHSEAELRRAQAVSQTGSWRFDIERGLLHWSDETYRIFGISRNTPVTPALYRDRIHAEDRDRVAMAWTAALGGDHYDLEHRITVNGRVRWVRERAEFTLADDGRPLVAFGTVQDITLRKVIDNALRESEERFARAFLANPAALAISRLADGIIIDVNGACMEILGYSRRQMIGSTFDKLQIFEDIGDLNAKRDKQGALRRWETRIKPANGHIRQVEVSVEPIELDDEPCVLTMLIDITERKRAEAALHENRLVLEQAQILGQMGSWTADLATPYFDIGSEGARLIGLAPGSYSLEDFLALMPPSDRALIADSWKKALSSRTPYDVEHRVLVNNRVRWIHSRATMEYDERGKPVRAIGMIQDITEARQIRETLEQYQTHLEDIVIARTAEVREANRRLQVSDQRMKSLLSMSQIGTDLSERELLQLGIDEAERLTGSTIGYLHFVDEPAREINMVTWSTATLRQCASIYESHYPFNKAGLWADAIRLRRPVIHNDFQNESGRTGYPEGHVHLVRHLSVPVFEGGNAVMIVGVGNKPRDYDEFDAQELQLIGNDLWRIITRRRTEVALAEAKQAAEAANRAKGMFLANMSHEIRTPLNAVLGLAQIGHRQSAGRKAGELFERILDSGQHLLGIIDDILDYSKIEAGKLALENSEAQLGDIIDRAVSFTAERAFAKGLDFRVVEASDLPGSFRGDPLRLSQILVNLLGNAVKFTQEGYVLLSVARNENHLEIRVSDSGIGMEMDQIDRLFSPFEQADGSTTRRFGGTGLGLAICKHLLDLMGGTIRVSSAPGQGCTFDVVVPLEQLAEAKTTAGRVSLVALPESEQAFLVTALQASGVDVTTASTLAHADRHADLVVVCTDNHPPIDPGNWETLHNDGQRLAVVHTPGTAYYPLAARGNCLRLERPLRVRHLLAMLAAPASSPGARAGEAGRLAGVSILAAEDNEVNRLVLEEMLGMEGARLVCVGNGSLAVERIRIDGPAAFDLVLTDVQMPIMDGYEATREILRLAPAMPIIGLTAHAMPEEKARCMAAGMVGHLAKPFELNRLLELIRSFVPKARIGQRYDPAPDYLPHPVAKCSEIIDTAALSLRYRNRDAFIARLMEAVLVSHRETPSRLRDLGQKHDWNGLVLLAHSLKGTAGSIAAESIRELAYQAEMAARQQSQQAARFADELAAAMEALLREIHTKWGTATAQTEQ